MSTACQFEELDDAIGLLTIDLPGKPVNTLGRLVIAELSEHVAQLAARDDIRGLLFRSGKPGQFLAGADLHELGMLVDADEEMIEQGLSRSNVLQMLLGTPLEPIVRVFE